MEVTAPTLAVDGRLGATLTSSGTLELVDPLVAEHWTFALRGKTLVERAAVARRPPRDRDVGIELARLDARAADGSDATGRWLDALTNATRSITDRRPPSTGSSLASGRSADCGRVASEAGNCYNRPPP